MDKWLKARLREWREALKAVRALQRDMERAKIMAKAKKAGVSKNAMRTLELMLDGKWYRPHDPKTPKCMDELVSAGLVGRMGSPVIIEARYVPHGSKPYRQEKIYGG